jgi:hypothetical protein
VTRWLVLVPLAALAVLWIALVLADGRERMRKALTESPRDDDGRGGS